jgi:hypothetical protein
MTAAGNLISSGQAALQSLFGEAVTLLDSSGSTVWTGTATVSISKHKDLDTRHAGRADSESGTATIVPALTSTTIKKRETRLRRASGTEFIVEDFHTGESGAQFLEITRTIAEKVGCL